jgi:hypothetical protein
MTEPLHHRCGVCGPSPSGSAPRTPTFNKLKNDFRNVTFEEPWGLGSLRERLAKEPRVCREHIEAVCTSTGTARPFSDWLLTSTPRKGPLYGDRNATAKPRAHRAVTARRGNAVPKR